MIRFNHKFKLAVAVLSFALAFGDSASGWAEPNQLRCGQEVSYDVTSTKILFGHGDSGWHSDREEAMRVAQRLCDMNLEGKILRKDGARDRYSCKKAREYCINRLGGKGCGENLSVLPRSVTQTYYQEENILTGEFRVTMACSTDRWSIYFACNDCMVCVNDQIDLQVLESQ